MIPRLYVPLALAAGAEIATDSHAAHYLGPVLRRQPGDAVIVFNERDGEFSARLEKLGKNSARLSILALRRSVEPVPDLWLCFAPLKKEAQDFLIEKATELGIARFQPVATEYGQVHRVNEARLRANIIGAAEQTERLTLPELQAPLALDRLLADWPRERRLLLCAEAGPATPIADALVSLTREVNPPHAWAILVGPEGGFSPRELDRMRDLPFVSPIGLGPRILRAETAALSAIAIFQALCGDGRTRSPRPLRDLAIKE